MSVHVNAEDYELGDRFLVSMVVEVKARVGNGSHYFDTPNGFHKDNKSFESFETAPVELENGAFYRSTEYPLTLLYIEVDNYRTLRTPVYGHPSSGLTPIKSMASDFRKTLYKVDI